MVQYEVLPMVKHNGEATWQLVAGTIVMAINDDREILESAVQHLLNGKRTAYDIHSYGKP